MKPWKFERWIQSKPMVRMVPVDTRPLIREVPAELKRVSFPWVSVSRAFRLGRSHSYNTRVFFHSTPWKTQAEADEMAGYHTIPMTFCHGIRLIWMPDGWRDTSIINLKTSLMRIPPEKGRLTLGTPVVTPFCCCGPHAQRSRLPTPVRFFGTSFSVRSYISETEEQQVRAMFDVAHPERVLKTDWTIDPIKWPKVTMKERRAHALWEKRRKGLRDFLGFMGG